MMALISTVNNGAASIAAKSNLAFCAMAAPAVRGLTEPSAELLQSFTKETLADTICLLAFDRTIKLFLLKESLKKSHGRLDSLVIKCFAAHNKLLAVALVVQHIVPLKCKLVGGFQDVSYQKELGNVEHLFEMVQMHVWQGK
jgi:hypothetical protein